MYIREVGVRDVGWMNINQDKIQLRAHVNATINRRVPQTAGNIFIGKVTVSFSSITLFSDVIIILILP
jgi:hypothetical protein